MIRLRLSGHRRTAAITAGILVSVLLLTLLLWPVPPDNRLGHAPRLFHELENLGHPVAFAVLGFIWLNLWKTRYLAVLAALVLFGAAIELIQFATGRDPSWTDVAANGLGAGIAVSWHARRTVSEHMAIVALALTAIALAPFTWTLLAYAHRAQAAPVIWREGSLLFSHFSNRSGGAYPGISIVEPIRDWRAYRELQVEIDNPHPQSLHVVLRVHDRWHDQRYADRYNEEFLLPARQTTTVRIPMPRIESAPATRRLDMRNVSGLSAFQIADRGDPQPKVREIRLVP